VKAIVINHPNASSDQQDAQQTCIGVLELTGRLKECVQHFFGQLRLKAEVGSCKAGRNGHYYLTLKEGEASIDAMIWSRDAQGMQYLPKVGDEVIVTGGVSMRPRSGQSAFHIKHVVPTGAGLMQAEFERTCVEFKAQGLFDRARPLPMIPRGVGLITSVNSSAYHDFIKSVNERAPGIPIYIVDATMQGPDSLPSITSALRKMYQDPRVEVIAMTRGGGSMEQLWDFNHRELCLFIARSPKPVVVGIGHEDNTLIAELVADVRGHTPTKVAAAIFPKTSELNQKLRALVRHMDDSLNRIGMFRLNRLQQVTQILTPLCSMEARKQRVEERFYALDRSIDQKVRVAHQKLETLHLELHHQSPQVKVERAQHKLRSLVDQLQRYDGMRAATERSQLQIRDLHDHMDHILHEKTYRFTSLIEQLELLSPLKTLSRGYSLVKDEVGTVIQDVSSVSLGDQLNIKLREGELIAEVTQIHSSSIHKK
jgi:exodeoxyribonuclease VII large subunit